jgi:hypothetical protein
MELSAMAAHLRQLVVGEWRNHQEKYEGYVVGMNITQQIDLFLRDGYFNSELGNTMVLALANVFGVPIVVFSSIIQYPVINVNPDHMSVPLPVFVAYNHSGCGHYDAIITEETSLPSAAPHKGCHCGKSKSDRSQGSCWPMKTKYTEIIRCPCLRGKKACSTTCSCKNCKNPKPEPSTKSRRRSKHQWQVPIPKSGVFALQSGEAVETGPRSLQEYFLLHQCINYCQQECIETSADNVLLIYNVLARAQEHVNLVINVKKQADIEQFIREYETLKSVFESLCVTAITTNLTSYYHSLL